MENKTHYRNVFKSDHLGVADLEDFIEKGIDLTFTIKNVTQHILNPNIKNSGVVVAGKRISANIAHFKENIKPLVLNAGNSAIVKGFCNSSFVQDWNNVLVKLYIGKDVKSVTGGKTNGVRIEQIQPKQKAKPEFTEDKIEATKLKGITVEQIKAVYTISKEVEQKYIDYVATK